MTKQEYYDISDKRKVPLRCPCLNKCSRYKFTAFFIGSDCLNLKSNSFEDKMKEMNLLEANEEISKLLVAGESTTFIGGGDSFYINNGCPEFFLHEHEHKILGIPNFATHQLSYDKHYRSNDKFKPGESRHYTECPEYALHKSITIQLVKRKNISAKVKSELQKEIESKCPFCLNEDVGHFQIHHIDENRSNNNKINLLMLCAICHSKITKGDISREQVENIKTNLSRAI
ncbi:MAG: HNH endonuclease [Ferruginibacter sp.]|nr:HNH endonuclease [Ferruginibacter sp.]